MGKGQPHLVGRSGSTRYHGHPVHASSTAARPRSTRRPLPRTRARSWTGSMRSWPRAIFSLCVRSFEVLPPLLSISLRDLHLTPMQSQDVDSRVPDLGDVGRVCVCEGAKGDRREPERVSLPVRPGVDGRWWAEHVEAMPDRGRQERVRRVPDEQYGSTARSGFRTVHLAPLDRCGRRAPPPHTLAPRHSARRHDWASFTHCVGGC